jgi:hypothetical protein
MPNIGSKKLRTSTVTYECPTHGEVTKGHLKTCPDCRRAGIQKNGGKKDSMSGGQKGSPKPRMGKRGQQLQL